MEFQEYGISVKRKVGQKKISKILGSRRHPVCRVWLRITIMLFSEYGIPIAEISRNTGVST